MRKNRMMYGKNREMKKNCETRGSNRFLHAFILFCTMAIKYEPNRVRTHDHRHLETTPKPLHHLPSFGFDLSDIFLYNKTSSIWKFIGDLKKYEAY
jgi:hypothetical protein